MMAQMQREDIVNYMLMHKNIEVAELKIGEASGAVLEVVKTFNIEHAPLGTVNRLDKKLNPVEIEAWIKGRAIPASRQNIEKLLREIGISNPSALALRSYGLSLSDQYWLKPEYLDKDWEEINFFHHSFSEDIGIFLCQNQLLANPLIKIISPDNNANGVLRKKWLIHDDKRILIKGDSDLNEQRPFNEEIAAKLMDKLGIEHVTYTTTMNDGKYYCECENFITESTEYITAAEVLVSIGPNVVPKNETPLKQLLTVCKHLGLIGIKQKLEEMMVVDYILANTDRHWGNFGFIRDAKTLMYKGFAPIFDTGNSLWFDKRTNSEPVLCESFAATQEEQIKLVTDLSWYHPIPEKELTEMLSLILDKNIFLDKRRKEMIIEGVIRNAEFITQLKKELHG